MRLLIALLALLTGLSTPGLSRAAPVGVADAEVVLALASPQRVAPGVQAIRAGLRPVAIARQTVNLGQALPSFIGAPPVRLSDRRRQ